MRKDLGRDQNRVIVSQEGGGGVSHEEESRLVGGGASHEEGPRGRSEGRRLRDSWGV